jgi:hypothetical protein
LTSIKNLVKSKVTTGVENERTADPSPEAWQAFRHQLRDCFARWERHGSSFFVIGWRGAARRLWWKEPPPVPEAVDLKSKPFLATRLSINPL